MMWFDLIWRNFQDPLIWSECFFYQISPPDQNTDQIIPYPHPNHPSIHLRRGAKRALTKSISSRFYWFLKSLYLEIDKSSEALVFETGFPSVSAFQFGAFCQLSTPNSRDMTKSNRHLRSIDLVEISRSVVKSSKTDPKNSKYGQFQFPLINWSFASNYGGWFYPSIWFSINKIEKIPINLNFH